MSDDIELGEEVQDKVSGFRGVVVAIADHLSGCNRIGVRANDTETLAHRSDEEFFYEDQLEQTGEAPFAERGEKAQTDTEITLGEEVRDDVTGFEGIASTIRYELYNCPRIAVTPVDDSSPTENGDREWFDAPRLSVIGEGVTDEYADLQEAATSETGSSGSDGSRKQSKPP